MKVHFCVRVRQGLKYDSSQPGQDKDYSKRRGRVSFNMIFVKAVTRFIGTVLVRGRIMVRARDKYHIRNSKTFQSQQLKASFSYFSVTMIKHHGKGNFVCI